MMVVHTQVGGQYVGSHPLANLACAGNGLEAIDHQYASLHGSHVFRLYDISSNQNHCWRSLRCGDGQRGAWLLFKLYDAPATTLI